MVGLFGKGKVLYAGEISTTHSECLVFQTSGFTMYGEPGSVTSTTVPRVVNWIGTPGLVGLASALASFALGFALTSDKE